MRQLPPTERSTKVMVFVDGENLAIRYFKLQGEKEKPGHVKFEKDIFVWSDFLNLKHKGCEVIRKYYYTSIIGDEKKVEEIQDKLKEIGIEEPCVFKKSKTRPSKRVDISLATDMLTHAHRKNYDVAILVAGDEDYLPLIEAVKMEGRRAILWFFENKDENKEGLSSALKRGADYFYDVGRVLLNYDKSELDSFEVHGVL